MIRAKHTYPGMSVLRFFSGYRLQRAFRSIHFHGTIADREKPVLIIANHFCWWDGFIQFRLNQKFLKRKPHVMMLEEELKKFPVLNRMGAYSVQKKTRDVITSLNYTVDLLADAKNMVLLFPQGEIQSLHTTVFHFENGLQYILNHLKNDIQVIFNVNLVDYFSDKKPSLYVYFTEYDYTDKDLTDIGQDFNRYASWCRTNQKKE